MWSQKDGRLLTVTQVKVLSLEMMVIALGEGLAIPEASIAVCASGEHVSNMPGSKATVSNRIVCVGTWDSHVVPNEAFNKLQKRRRKYGNVAVGLTHSRGVDGVTPIESPSSLEGVSSRMQRDEDAYAVHRDG